MANRTSSQLETLRHALRRALSLKEVDRAGWLRVGVEAPESVAAHSWGVCYLVLALCPEREGFDRGKALAMAVIHALAATTPGDITPHDGVERDEQVRREAHALQALVAPLRNNEELHRLWQEFEEGSSREGRFVRACDKLDMALQAQRYAEWQGYDTSEFIESALESIDDEDLKSLIVHEEG
jgi:putative hydrolase of HD superfamily